MADILKVDRRRFMQTTAAAGAGLVLGFYLPEGGPLAAGPGEPFAPNAWLGIEPSGEVTVWVAKSEMGQGVLTSMPMIVAEELDADWSRVRVRQALTEPKYGNMMTGGSTSVRRSWNTLREAGAAARAMLVAAAASAWKVEAASCRTEKGQVIHGASGRKRGYGELASAAARLAVPEKPPLKDPKTFRIVGTSVPRLDTPEKVDGSAVFGMDVKVPGMLFAALARCPVFGGTLKSFDAAKAEKVPGVKRVVAVDGAVAVLAENTWAALQGRDALAVTWDEGPAAGVDSAALWKMFEEKSKESGAAARRDGDAAAALAAAAKRVEAVYRAPFLAHATMEPMDATAHVRQGGAELWLPTQAPTWAQEEVAKALGLPREKVVVHTTFLGGGFGRRSMPDFPVEAAKVSRAAGAPVKVVWSREDDMRHDFYRPMSLHVMAGGLDAAGRLVAFTHKLVAPSISEQLWPGSVKNGLDESAVDGAANVPYAFPSAAVSYVMANTHVPVGWWRSVYASQNAFATECFLDELAQEARRDPVEFRMALLEKSPMRAALEAATQGVWNEPLPKGQSRGVACCECFGSRVAQVAEVSVAKGEVRVHRVICGVDCGNVVNPDTLRAQMESAVAYGLSAALGGEITIEKGRVRQGGFDDYPVLRVDRMPEVVVNIAVTSPDYKNLGGIGEPGLPPLAPAVVNAVSRILGRRVRQLPIRL